jgi:hypothetical protein
MPFYVASPFKAQPQLLIQGKPEYVFGSLNDKTAPTFGYVLSDSGNGTTSTVVFQITQGNIPIPGSLITVIGTANAAGAYNTTNATVLTVVVTPQGVATVSFAGAGTSASASDSGQVMIPQPEIGDLLTAGIISALPVSSIPVAGVVGATTVGRSMGVTVSLPPSSAAFPSTLAAVTVVLQGANLDAPGEYNTIATLGAGLAAGSVTDWQSGQGDTATGTLAAGSVNLLSFRFYRLQVSTGATGTGYIIGKIMQ